MSCLFLTYVNWFWTWFLPVLSLSLALTTEYCYLTNTKQKEIVSFENSVQENSVQENHSASKIYSKFCNYPPRVRINLHNKKYLIKCTD